MRSSTMGKPRFARAALVPDRAQLTRALLLALPIALLLLWLPALSGMRARFAPALVSMRCCGPQCRSRAPDVEVHYDEKYFAWQTRLGREKAEKTDWMQLLGALPTDVVADLGAGGGHILATLNVSRRIAVEINPNARASIRNNYPNIERFVYPEQVPDASVDLLYSTSALEHFECPLTELREMARKVKVGGRVAIGVKNEGVQYAVNVRDDDINQHLWTWNRQLLYNLVKRAGFVVERIDPPTEEMLKSGSKWGTEKAAKSFETHVYHWAHGVKKIPSPPLE